MALTIEETIQKDVEIPDQTPGKATIADQVGTGEIVALADDGLTSNPTYGEIADQVADDKAAVKPKAAKPKAAKPEVVKTTVVKTKAFKA